MDALHGVVRRGPEVREEVLPARDELDVHRLDIAAVDQAKARVARRGDEVVLAAATATAAAHQRDHLVRGAGILPVDDAARLLLERLRERRIRVGRPLDEVQRAFSLPDRRRNRARRAHARRRHAHRRRKSREKHVCPFDPIHCPSPSLPIS